MSTQTITSKNRLQEHSTSYQRDQYTLWQVLGIWSSVALPMAVLSWLVAPVLVPRSPLYPGITFWLLMIVGMAWQFIVSLTIIYRELGTLRWSAICQRTWLQIPRDPRTDRPNPKLLGWLLPAFLFAAVVGFGLAGYLDGPVTALFPALHPAAYQDMNQMSTYDLKGQWWLLGIALASALFNYFLGEEFLFRGVLLPKMGGVFGKYDWVANAVLFGLYHLHKPWNIPSIIVGSLAITWPARFFRSNWMAVIVHGVEGIFMFIGILAVVLGLPGS